MAGPALALGYLLILCFFTFLLFLLIYIIVYIHNRKRSIPAGILFLVLTGISLLIYFNNKYVEEEDSKKFLGAYKLERLDGKECINCKVTINDGYTYHIFANGKLVGNGRWQRETAIDIPGSFIKIENGPGIIWEHERLIKFIIRP